VDAHVAETLYAVARLAGEIGIRHVTVSTPFLLEVIKARRPQFTVKVGIYAQVDTPRRAKFWEDLGADAINLESFSINRDFSRLAAIREAVRCDLQLIANHCCLPNCPLQSYHQNGFAHSSDGSRTIFIDYCFLRCSQMRLEDPSLFIKSAWIRPEDLSRYEAMGYTTFKLIERGMPSAELLKRVAAYSARRFDGNLAELLLPYCFEQPVRQSRFWMLRYFFKPFQLAPHKLLRLLELVRSQGMLFPNSTFLSTSTRPRFPMASLMDSSTAIAPRPTAVPAVTVKRSASGPYASSRSFTARRWKSSAPCRTP